MEECPEKSVQAGVFQSVLWKIIWKAEGCLICSFPRSAQLRHDRAQESTTQHIGEKMEFYRKTQFDLSTGETSSLGI